MSENEVGNNSLLNLELAKLQDILENMDKTIYSRIEDQNSDSECRKLLKQINLRLRSMTQHYKLMNKGYTSDEQLKEMVKGYKNQVSTLEGEIAQLKEHIEADQRKIIDELEEQIGELDETAGKLENKLRFVKSKADEVRKELCIEYLSSNNLDNAIHHMKKMTSRYLMNIIHTMVEHHKTSNFVNLILFAAEYPDLDDRVEAFITLLNISFVDMNIKEKDLVLIETMVYRLLDLVVDGSQITDEKLNQMNQSSHVFASMASGSYKKWIDQLSEGMLQDLKVHFESFHPKQIVHLDSFLKRKFLELTDSMAKFDMIRNYVKLLGMTHGINQHRGALILLDQKISYTLMTIMSIGMDDSYTKSEEMKTIVEMIKPKLPESLRVIENCTKAIQIFQKKSNKCIQISNQVVKQFKDVFQKKQVGNLQKIVVTGKTADCTTFQIVPTPDKRYVELKTADGTALSAIDSFTPGIVSYTSYVGVKQVPLPGFKSETDSRWLIEPNYRNNTLKITSEFNVYWHKRTRDYLITERIDNADTVVLQRYAYYQVDFEGRERLSDWILKCSSNA
ncbi:uncharacterized protein LOC129738337 [Uranotaenia lowii]|uniref:uncharacterized protein LOC129738337 n=1 Tax=Uranotaenia lowii TaxID=190385 RepID=UPI00247B2461|nr:uncharacterized protein LOC129738337 [Uranotaenia lowii]